MNWSLRISLVILVLFGTSSTVDSQIENAFGTVTNKVTGLLQLLLNGQFTPTTLNELKDFGVDLIIGTPTNLILDALNLLCSISISVTGDVPRPTVEMPNIDKVSVMLMDDKYNRSYTLDQMDEMMNSETFNKDYPVVILTTGWLTMADKKNNLGLNLIYSAYKCRGKTNFILFDSAMYIVSLYFWSAANTQILGDHLGQFVAKMSETIPLENFHLIGHSLGAQISGFAGRSFTQITGKFLPRITGLDPARPCFSEGQSLNCIGRGDAEFVDIIHSNSGGLGIRSPTGDADFYPNGLVSVQPFTPDISVAHSFAVEVYAESVYPGSEESFMARKCDSIFNYNRGKCISEDIPMGYATPRTAKGNFLLNTGYSAPYGKSKINTCSNSVIADTNEALVVPEDKNIMDPSNFWNSFNIPPIQTVNNNTFDPFAQLFGSFGNQ